MSGTVLFDLGSSGDLPNFHNVNGSHDVAFDSFGIVAPSSFTAYPWSTTSPDPLSDDWKNVDTKERRAPSGKFVEEFCAAIDSAHSRNDLATDHDALAAWELPDGSAAGTMTIGGTQFNGHVFPLRSWWKHYTEQRLAVARAIDASNLYDGGDTLASLAETFLATTNSWNSGAGPTPILNGKFTWANWRRLLFPWTPVRTSYGGAVYRASYRWTVTAGQTDWDEGGVNFAVLVSGLAGSTARAGIISSNPLGSPVKTAQYAIYAGPEFLCSSSSTITRPQSSLRNLFGWPDGTTLRLVRGSRTTDGAISCDLKLGFFWMDVDIGTNDWPSRCFSTDSTILGSVTDTEQAFDIDAILDEEWPATASVSTTRRRPCFWIGPEWGSTIPDDVFGGTGLRDDWAASSATDDAATGGYDHGLPWQTGTGSGFLGPRICTERYPFTAS